MLKLLKVSALLLPVTYAAVDTRSLSEAAKGLGIYIGTAISTLHTKDQQYDQVDFQNYDLITAENGCKMKHIATSYTQLDYSKCIQLKNMAQSKDQAFRAHNLIWARQGKSPDFVANEQDSAKLEEFMFSYINSTVKAIGDYPIVWDVINEAVDGADGTFIRDSPWSKIDDFICKAFNATRNANPNIGRFYNDFSIITGQNKKEKVYKLVKELHDRKCGITGVGFQSHVTIDFNHDDILKSALKQYEDLGLDVHITELSVKCSVCKQNWTDEQLQKQANVFSNILSACLEAPNCKSFETWGFTDEYSFLKGPLAGMPFDNQMHPKLAYDAMYKVLQDFPRDHPAVQSRIQKNQVQVNFLQ